MHSVGLTGGIGSGKSTIAAAFKEMGAKVVDADALAKQAVLPGTEASGAIRRRFGDDVFLPSGELDRRSLGQRVFTDPQARADLEAIVHPEVARLAEKARQAARQSGASLYVYDVPLLFERKLEEAFDSVVVVYADPSTRKQRLLKRDAISLSEIEDRIASQLPLEEKRARADYVIDNNGSLEASLHEARALASRLMNRNSQP